MKIYTKTGDGGTTSFFGGKRVGKGDLRVEAYGNVDELNSLLGVVVSGLVARLKASGGAEADLKKLMKKLIRVQSELMVLGSDLATPLTVKIKIPRVTPSFVKRLEQEIDNSEDNLPQLKNFILPGGSIISSWLHLTRSVTRRVERSIVRLAQEEEINKNVLIYANRLSDWLFTLALFNNKNENVEETIWKGRGK